jgi:hypothetical protein
MRRIGLRRGFGAHIGCGGARESSRQYGRNAEKAVACQSERGSLPNSASPPPNAPSPATFGTPPHTAKGGRHDCLSASRLSQSRDAVGDFVVVFVVCLFRDCPRTIRGREHSVAAQTEPRAVSLVQPRTVRLACTASLIANSAALSPQYPIAISSTLTAAIAHAGAHASASLPRTGRTNSCHAHVQHSWRRIGARSSRPVPSVPASARASRRNL